MIGRADCRVRDVVHVPSLFVEDVPGAVLSNRYSKD